MGVTSVDTLSREKELDLCKQCRPVIQPSLGSLEQQLSRDFWRGSLGLRLEQLYATVYALHASAGQFPVCLTDGHFVSDKQAPEGLHFLMYFGGLQMAL